MVLGNSAEKIDSDGGIPAVSDERSPRVDACCKVQRVAKAYSLPGIDSELRRQRTEADATLHELADYVNTRLTAKGLKQAGVDIDVEPATVRAALENDGTVSIGRRDRIREMVAGHLKIDQLTDDFVSHETIRRHLKEHLDISTSRGGFETVPELRDALETYQEQYGNAIEGALRRAEEQGLIAGNDYNVFSTRVECTHCSSTYRIQELIEKEGCDCEEPPAGR